MRASSGLWASSSTASPRSVGRSRCSGSSTCCWPSRTAVIAPSPCWRPCSDSGSASGGRPWTRG
eukprot:2776559-Lingulodinium_polyedra.AAC.1